MNLIDVRVGSALGRVRRSAGYSRERLAVAVGVRPERLDAFEAGAERIGAWQLHVIVGALGVPVSAFFEGMTATPPVAPDLSRR